MFLRQQPLIRHLSSDQCSHYERQRYPSRCHFGGRRLEKQRPGPACRAALRGSPRPECVWPSQFSLRWQCHVAPVRPQRYGKSFPAERISLVLILQRLLSRCCSADRSKSSRCCGMKSEFLQPAGRDLWGGMLTFDNIRLRKRPVSPVATSHGGLLAGLAFENTSAAQKPVFLNGEYEQFLILKGGA